MDGWVLEVCRLSESGEALAWIHPITCVSPINLEGGETASEIVNQDVGMLFQSNALSVCVGIQRPKSLNWQR